MAIAVDVGALNSIFFDVCPFWQKSRKIVENREKVPSGTRQNFPKNFGYRRKTLEIGFGHDLGEVKNFEILGYGGHRGIGRL